MHEVHEFHPFGGCLSSCGLFIMSMLCIVLVTWIIPVGSCYRCASWDRMTWILIVPLISELCKWLHSPPEMSLTWSQKDSVCILSLLYLFAETIFLLGSLASLFSFCLSLLLGCKKNLLQAALLSSTCSLLLSKKPSSKSPPTISFVGRRTSLLHRRR